MEFVSTDSLFAKVTAHFKAELPFVVYRKPNSETVIGLFQYDAKTNLVADFSETGYVFAPFSGNRVFIIPQNASAAVASDITVTEPLFLETEFSANEVLRAKHLVLVQNGIEAIKKQQFSKVVLSRKEILDMDHFNLEATFTKLLGLYPTAFVYCWFHPETGLWLGAFSEQLLKFSNNQLATMSVAGTQKWHEGTITWQKKEIEEQQIVTNFIVDSLNVFSDTISVSEPYTLKAGNIVHIKTDIKAGLSEDVKLRDIISALHPTPAVCGMPKETTRRFILENEQYDREFYSGFHGELNRDFASGTTQTDLFVNLRCMKIQNDKASLFIGGGITKDSDPEHEWTETVNKAQTMKKVLTQNK